MNEYLDEKIRCTIQSKRPLRREILDIFIYGGLAHADDQKREVFTMWRETPIVYAVLESEFCNTLERVTRIIRSVWQLNLRVIEELETKHF